MIVNREPRPRTYLMCAPEHFVVRYAINPWMDVDTPVDTDLAGKQWEVLRETLVGLGHTIHTLEPLVGLPDMVYAANGAFSVDAVVYGARFRYPQRAAEAAAHRTFYEVRSAGWRFVAAEQTNEGEGDLAYLPMAYGGLVLAGYGFRTDVAAHAEVQEVLGRPVVSLRLVDPRFYHLDTALAMLDDSTIAYYPPAFSEAAHGQLRALFPDAIIVGSADAYVLGLNAVSDGFHVVHPRAATRFASQLCDRGFEPVGVDLSELLKGGGSVKCCTLELRGQ